MELTQRPEQPVNTKTMAELLLLEMDRVAKLEAVLTHCLWHLTRLVDKTPNGTLDAMSAIVAAETILQKSETK